MNAELEPITTADAQLIAAALRAAEEEIGAGRWLPLIDVDDVGQERKLARLASIYEHLSGDLDG